jgi:formylglycine-generating enzyme required for sulfatase activity
MKRTAFFVVLALVPFTLLSCAAQRQAAISDPVIIDGMILIDQGTFTMGSDDGEVGERPEHEVFVSTYLIDRYEVSAREFADFLNARGNADDPFFSAGRHSTVVEGADGSYAPRKGYDAYPANNLTWYGASSYCQWADKRLPTEAEWEKAARGGDVRIYPWGNDPPDEKLARYDQAWGGEGRGVLTPVDALPAGASYYGAFHMAGNVWEWVGDWYRQNYCSFCPDVDRSGEVAARLLGKENNPFASRWEEQEMISPERVDPRGPAFGYFKVLRGGSWSDAEPLMKVTVRYWRLPEERGLNIGFRCARDSRQ